MDNIILGGISSSMATVFTNPLEVIKTRLQLQGELRARGEHFEPYKSVFQAFVAIAKNDGIVALQNGLAASLVFQFILNAARLGIYNTANDYSLTKNADGTVSLMKSAMIGGVGGVVGLALASPFFMLRTHMQSQAVTKIAVGYQHNHSGMWNALKNIYRSNGIAGLYRGSSIALPRGLIGSGAQIGTFGYTKDRLQRQTKLNQTVISFISGSIAGTVMAIAMNPSDVIATRLYNQGVNAQGKGMLYSGVTDCFIKIWKAEGIRGFYKGFWPHYIRIGPHSALVLLFFDELKSFKMRIVPHIAN